NDNLSPSPQPCEERGILALCNRHIWILTNNHDREMSVQRAKDLAIHNTTCDANKNILSSLRHSQKIQIVLAVSLADDHQLLTVRMPIGIVVTLGVLGDAVQIRSIDVYDIDFRIAIAM